MYLYGEKAGVFSEVLNNRKCFIKTFDFAIQCICEWDWCFVKNVELHWNSILSCDEVCILINWLVVNDVAKGRRSFICSWILKKMIFRGILLVKLFLSRVTSSEKKEEVCIFLLNNYTQIFLGKYIFFRGISNNLYLSQYLVCWTIKKPGARGIARNFVFNEFCIFPSHSITHRLRKKCLFISSNSANL